MKCYNMSCKYHSEFIRDVCAFLREEVKINDDGQCSQYLQTLKRKKP